MIEKSIEVNSYWGITIKNDYFMQDSDTLIVILPGYKYTILAPLLYYSLNVALESGYDVLALNYGFHKQDIELKNEEKEYSISESKEAILKALAIKSDYKKIIFLGKSMGTTVQCKLINDFSNYEQLHIFLTPLPECIETIKNSKGCLVIVGEDDHAFKQVHLKMIEDSQNIKTKTIERADHRLETGDYRESIDILKDVSNEIHNYINMMI